MVIADLAEKSNLRAFALERIDTRALHPTASPAIDLVVLDDHLLLLFADRLSLLSLLDMSEPLVDYNHAVVGATAVHVSPGRVLIEGRSGATGGVELIDSVGLMRFGDLTQGLLTQAEFEDAVRLGRAEFSAAERFRHARVNGDGEPTTRSGRIKRRAFAKRKAQKAPADDRGDYGSPWSYRDGSK